MARARPPRAGNGRTIRLLMTLLVRNEAEMIEDNLDYHLAQGVDFVIVTDHASTDGTAELLRPYEREGVVAVLRDDEDAHHQSRRVTNMARLAATDYGADWIIHNDADEFWWPVAGTLRDVFAAIPSDYGQIEVRRVNFLPGAVADEPFHATMVHRDARSLNLRAELLEPKCAHRAHPDVVVAPGNHRISGVDLRPVPIAGLLEIFHFPMREYAQFERKVTQTGVGYEALDDRSPGTGDDQLRLLELQRRGELRAHFDAALGDEDSRGRGLADGSIVLDRRLQRFMRDLAEGREPASWGAADGTLSLVAGALRADRELIATRESLARSEAERAALSELLGQVRESRLMRWTAPLRRRWYRLRGADRAGLA
jgi:hypothetical protein